MALVTFQPACHSSILCLELPNSPPPPLLAESTLWERAGAPGAAPGAPSPLALFKLDSSVSCGLRPYLAKCSASSLLLRHESGRAERTDVHAEPIAGMIDGNAVFMRLNSCAIFFFFFFFGCSSQRRDQIYNRLQSKQIPFLCVCFWPLNWNPLKREGNPKQKLNS